MKNISLLIWLTQLGLSVATPLAGFILVGVWLYNRYNLGVWIILLATGVGIACAASGFRNSLKSMDRMASKEAEESIPVSYNDHE